MSIVFHSNLLPLKRSTFLITDHSHGLDHSSPCLGRPENCQSPPRVAFRSSVQCHTSLERFVWMGQGYTTKGGGTRRYPKPSKNINQAAMGIYGYGHRQNPSQGHRPRRREWWNGHQMKRIIVAICLESAGKQYSSDPFASFSHEPLANETITLIEARDEHIPT